jgi:hypothetical protein
MVAFGTKTLLKKPANMFPVGAAGVFAEKYGTNGLRAWRSSITVRRQIFRAGVEGFVTVLPT